VSDTECIGVPRKNRHSIRLLLTRQFCGALKQPLS
jgi:hypothetical protein